MLLDKKLLGLSKITSKDGYRVALNCIQLTKTHATATDGYKLLQIQLDDQSKVKDHPISSDDNFGDELLIPGRFFERSLKDASRNKSLPILENVVVTKSEDSIEIGSTNLDATRVIRFNKVDAEYPKWEKIKPTSKPKAEIRISIDHLKEMVEALEKTGIDHVDLEIRSELKPFVIKGKMADERSIYGLIMPVRKA